MRRAVVTIFAEEQQRSVVQAGAIVGRSRTAFDRAPNDAPDEADAPISTALLALVAQHTRWGFWTCWTRLRALGHRWNHKRVHRVYCARRLTQVRRTKQRRPTRVIVPRHAPAERNNTWAMDFMGETL